MKASLAALAALLALAGCNDQITGLEPPSDPTKETFAPSLNVNIAAMTRNADGVYFADMVPGTGDTVTAKTDSVFVSYAGYLKDGKLFDSGTNVKFIPSALIPGFRSGMVGMRQGGRRKLVIPSELGYGRSTVKNPDGTTKIPRQSTLVFDVELLRVHNPAPPAT